MIGGTGDDTYVVDNAGDVVTEVSGPYAPPPGWTIQGTADLNGDGQLDLAVTDGTANELWLLKDGAVLSSVVLPLAGLPLKGLIDLDGDGDKDVLYQIPDGRQWAQYLNGTTLTTNGSVSGRTPDAVQTLPGGNEGTDLVQASLSYTLAQGVENLTLTAGTGNINGTGNAAANVIVGNEGNNILAGKGGADTLTGGAGADTFVFNLPSEGTDAITDFVRGTDTVQVSASGFGGGLAAGATPILITAADGAATSNPGSKGYFIFDSSGADAGTVLWDATGGSGADAVAIVKLEGITSLLPSDFHVA
jgi:Ca2+-binding RTX toxin-like protein